MAQSNMVLAGQRTNPNWDMVYSYDKLKRQFYILRSFRGGKLIFWAHALFEWIYNVHVVSALPALLLFSFSFSNFRLSFSPPWAKTFPFRKKYIPTGWNGFVMLGFWCDLDIWIERTAVKYAGKITFDCTVDSVKQITLLFILLFKPSNSNFVLSSSDVCVRILWKVNLRMRIDVYQ